MEVKRSSGLRRQEEIIISRIRTGHCFLNDTLFRMGKHPNGFCSWCNAMETAEHVLISCRKYVSQRRVLRVEMGRVMEL